MAAVYTSARMAAAIWPPAHKAISLRQKALAQVARKDTAHRAAQAQQQVLSCEMIPMTAPIYDFCGICICAPPKNGLDGRKS